MWRSICTLAIAAGLVACGPRASDLRRDTGSSPADSGSQDPQDAGQPDNGGGQQLGNILVKAVFDGDTISVSAGQTVYTPDGKTMDGTRIRLLGVDAPEIAHPPKGADCWGDESHDFARMKAQGRLITLRYDAQNGYRDPYDRLLAYVVIDGEVLNEALIREGHARAFRAFRHKDYSRYIDLEREARNADKGLWTCP